VATFVLIHRAGDSGWYWHLVEPEVRARGHDIVAPDLPCEDDSAGLSDYADVVLNAIGARGELVSSRSRSAPSLPRSSASGCPSSYSCSSPA
jgi:hypothetical protein